MDETKDIMDIAKPQWLEQMEGILETLNEGVLIADADDHVLFVNSVFEEMTGIFRGDILDRDAAQLYHSPEDYAVVQRLRQKALRMGRIREEFFLPTKNGQRLPVIVNSRLIQDPEGRQLAIVTFTDISEQKGAQVELRAANEQLEDRQKELEQDLMLAARVQQSLLPKSLVWGGMRVESYYHPARAIGGDFGLVSPLDEQHLDLLVCDVSGHGISSALVANRIYSETITQLHNGAPLGDMLRQLNRLLKHDIGGWGFFLTLAALRVDRNGKCMVFAGAGHPPVMVVQPGEEPRMLESGNMILGAFPDPVDMGLTVDVELQSKDRIVLYTDGLTEVFNSGGEMLGIEGLQEFVRETSVLPLVEMKNGILDRVAAWREGPPTDDISLVLVEISGRSSE
jgi:sigma-B regulation protein RsbU (phosphoserine phosphatase)